jgi:hypothetical protein
VLFTNGDTRDVAVTAGVEEGAAAAGDVVRVPNCRAPDGDGVVAVNDWPAASGVVNV